MEKAKHGTFNNSFDDLKSQNFSKGNFQKYLWQPKVVVLSASSEAKPFYGQNCVLASIL